MNKISKFYINLVLLILLITVSHTGVGQELQASFLNLPKEITFEKSNAAQQSLDGKLWFEPYVGMTMPGNDMDGHLGLGTSFRFCF